VHGGLQVEIFPQTAANLWQGRPWVWVRSIST